MAKIKKDDYGLYVSGAGCGRIRPVYPTQFKEGDEVKTHHFSGSIRAGVGKDKTCKLGQYLEYWCTSGEWTEPYPMLGIHTFSDQLAWYAAKFKKRFPNVTED